MDTENTNKPRCAACPVRNREERRCVNEQGKNPPECPTVNKIELIRQVQGRYLQEDILQLARVASQVECDGYIRQQDGPPIPSRPRIVEIVDFCRRMNYKRLGLVFCLGLRHEAAITNEILEKNGFEVVSAICKAGGVPKSFLGLTREEQINPAKSESMCNPILQAEIMNEAEVDFNILLGLCVGHDTMALRALKAPATILAVKDRLLGHNPLAAIYNYDSYYRFLGKPINGCGK